MRRRHLTTAQLTSSRPAENGEEEEQRQHRRVRMRPDRAARVNKCIHIITLMMR